MQISDIASRLATAVAYLGQFTLILLAPFLLSQDSKYFWILFIIFLLIPPLSILMQLSLSRVREYAADVDAVILTNNPNGLKNALLKLNTIEENILLKIFNPFSKSLEPSLLRTHPDTKSRIQKLEELNYKEIYDDFTYKSDDEFFKTNPTIDYI